MGYRITKTEKRYSRTASGKSWKKNPDSVTKEEITKEHYDNYIDSVPFFNRFGYGAYCRAHRGYTYMGYIPVSVVTVNPGRTEKIVAQFGIEKA